MRWFVLPLSSLLWLVNVGCKSDRCETKLDCPSGQECNEGVCEPVMPICQVPPCGGIDRPDAGPDAGRDAGDGGEDMDAGDGGDGGDLDAGDGGAPDGGDGGMDAGDGGLVLVPAGEVRLSEVTDFTTAVIGHAEFLDRTTGTYEISTEEYAPPNASCGLVRVTLLSGQPTGIEAEAVTVDLDNNRSITYEPVGNGRYEPQNPPLPGVFDGATTVDFAIVSNNMNGTLEDAMATTPAPITVSQAQPAPGSQLFLSIPFSLTWSGMGMPTDGRRTVVELYDDGREVRLTCRLTSDTGSFSLPSDAVQDFLAESPMQPYTLELRYEYVAIVAVPVVGSASDLPVSFRASKGVRWPIQ